MLSEKLAVTLTINDLTAADYDFRRYCQLVCGRWTDSRISTRIVIHPSHKFVVSDRFCALGTRRHAFRYPPMFSIALHSCKLLESLIMPWLVPGSTLQRISCHGACIVKRVFATYRLFSSIIAIFIQLPMVSRFCLKIRFTLAWNDITGILFFKLPKKAKDIFSKSNLPRATFFLLTILNVLKALVLIINLSISNKLLITPNGN